MATAATFLTTSFTSVSSLDTGRIGYFVAWGGSEDGYAYTYSASGAPSGVTVSTNAGILTFASTVAAGSYTFTVTATNREDTSKIANFSYTLNVLSGVTSSRTGTQVLHKTYDPHDSGSFGSPSGSDWTSVLLAIQTAILADQVTNVEASGNETQLRAVIPFHKGATYQYTNNHWLDGIQYYDVTATGSGANPILQNNGSETVYEGGPLNIGSGGAMNHQGSIKANSALINTVTANSTTVTCSTHAQVSRLVVGRWHQIIGSCIQIGGYPPNTMFGDYVLVTAVDAGTGVVTLDRPLKYAYDSTWFETAADDDNFGRAWIVPWDTGGSAGTIPSDPRITLRGRFYNINFQANPNGSDIMLLQAHIQSDFDTCTIQALQVTMGKHYGVFGGTIVANSEPDKLSEMLFLSGPTSTGVLSGATGFQYVLGLGATFNNNGVSSNTVQISPRQARFSGCTFDAKASSTPPYTFSYNGPTWYLHFITTVFKSSVTNTWTYPGSAFSPLTIGTHGTWSGNQLRIPTSSPKFQDWLINAYTGGIVAIDGLGPITANWGYIDSVTSDGAGGAVWLNISWVNGTKPTSGTIDIVGSQARRLFIESSCSFTGSLSYADARFAKQTATPFEANWDFPPRNSLQGAVKAQSQASGIATVTGIPVLNTQATAKSVSKAQGNFTLFSSGGGGIGVTLTCVSVTGVFP